METVSGWVYRYMYSQRLNQLRVGILANWCQMASGHCCLSVQLFGQSTIYGQFAIIAVTYTLEEWRLFQGKCMAMYPLRLNQLRVGILLLRERGGRPWLIILKLLPISHSHILLFSTHLLFSMMLTYFRMTVLHKWWKYFWWLYFSITEKAIFL